MKKLLLLLALGACMDDRRDRDIASLHVRVTKLEADAARLRECIARMQSSLRPEDAIANLNVCVTVGTW